MQPAEEPAGPFADPVEELLAACLCDSHLDAEIERACAAHPEHAAELRRRLQTLRQVGLSPSQPNWCEPPPSRLGNYRLIERLGGGGMGVVWRAVEEPLGREVAVKLVRAEHLNLVNARKRFLREIEVVAQLHHPGIVPVYTFGEHGDVPYYAMELIAGRSLAELLLRLQGESLATLSPSHLRAEAPNWPDACCAVIADVARALHHSHQRGIVHRDVKPSNIMLADDGRVLLIDFGLAQVEGAETVTRTGAQPGSLRYMSPEQVRGEAVDRRTDVWSLGVTLYELLTLQAPFRGDTAESMRRQILAAVPPPLQQRNPRVSWEVATIVATALAPEPQRRYPTALAMAQDLEAAVRRRPITARRPAPWLRLRRLAQRHEVLATAAGLSLLLLLALPSALLLQQRAANAAITQQAADAQQVVDFLQGLFREVEPERARGAVLPARAILDRGVQRVQRELAGQPAVQAELLQTLASVYLDLGLFTEAEALLAQLAALPAPARQQAARALLQARLDAARGRDADAERGFAVVLAALPPLGAGDDGARVDVTLALAQAIWQQDRLDEAERLLQQTVAALRRQPPGRLLFDALLSQARFLDARRDPRRAEAAFAEAQRLADAVLAPDHPRRIDLAIGAAGCASERGAQADAERLLQQALQLAQQLFDELHPQRGAVHEQLAAVLLAGGHAGAALTEIDRALRVFAAIHQPPHQVLARARSLRSSIDFELGDLAACAADGDSALAMFEQLAPQGSLEFALALANRCRLEVAFGRFADAVAAGERSVAMARRLGFSGTQQLASSLGHLAYAQALCGELPAAQAAIAEALPLIAGRPPSRGAAAVLSYAGEVHCFAGEAAAAEARASEALQQWRQLGDRSGEAWALFVQGWALQQQQQLEPAAAALQQSVQLRRQQLGERHPLVGIALSTLGVVQAGRGQLPAAEASLREAVALRRAAGIAGDRGLSVPLLNHAAVLQLLGRADAALPLALEAADLVEGKVPRGHREAQGVVSVLLRLRTDLPDGAARAALQDRLQKFSAAMLAGDDPLRRQLADG